MLNETLLLISLLEIATSSTEDRSMHSGICKCISFVSLGHICTNSDSCSYDFPYHVKQLGCNFISQQLVQLFVMSAAYPVAYRNNESFIGDSTQPITVRGLDNISILFLQNFKEFTYWNIIYARYVVAA